MQTDRFSATLGLTPGYFHANEGVAGLYALGALWQQHAAAVQAETGCYVGAVLAPSATVYHTEWGCPAGGELTVSLTGERNPVYDQDGVRYRAAVIAVLGRVAQALGQSTSQVTFAEVTLAYLDFRGNGELLAEPQGTV